MTTRVAYKLTGLMSLIGMISVVLVWFIGKVNVEVYNFGFLKYQPMLYRVSIALISSYFVCVALLMLVRLLTKDNPVNVLKAIRWTHRETKILALSRSALHDSTDVKYVRYQKALNWLNVKQTNELIELKVWRPKQADADKLMKEQLESVKDDLAVMNPDYAFNAIKVSPHMFIITGKKY